MLFLKVLTLLYFTNSQLSKFVLLIAIVFYGCCYFLVDETVFSALLLTGLFIVFLHGLGLVHFLLHHFKQDKTTVFTLFYLSLFFSIARWAVVSLAIFDSIINIRQKVIANQTNQNSDHS